MLSGLMSVHHSVFGEEVNSLVAVKQQESKKLAVAGMSADS